MLDLPLLVLLWTEYLQLYAVVFLLMLSVAPSPVVAVAPLLAPWSLLRLFSLQSHREIFYQ